MVAARIDASTGVLFTLKALVIVIMGGVGDMRGTIVAALLLGVLETFVAVVEAGSFTFNVKARRTPAAGRSGRLSLRLNAGEVFNSTPGRRTLQTATASQAEKPTHMCRYAHTTLGSDELKLLPTGDCSGTTGDAKLAVHVGHVSLGCVS